MGNTLKQLKKSSQFMTGFIILFVILILVIIYPIVVSTDQLEMVGKGIFYKPGTYVSVVDVVSQSMTSDKSYVLNIDASANRLSSGISREDREAMITWLEKYGGVEPRTLNTSDGEIEKLMNVWLEKYDESNPQKGLIAAKKKYYVRLNASLKELLKRQEIIIATIATPLACCPTL